jgi:hypothetical protein
VKTLLLSSSILFMAGFLHAENMNIVEALAQMYPGCEVSCMGGGPMEKQYENLIWNDSHNKNPEPKPTLEEINIWVSNNSEKLKPPKLVDVNEKIKDFDKRISDLEKTVSDLKKQN